ncbi:putative CPXV219 protein [Orthopoxvirus Abatino]|uniref:Putative CPXV219 protein n=1 Tax=Orthopoxvirus Abatino TaxID=2478919 RepID=A0A3G2KY65_9POXV|nr:putative CPXV219 protein [Orthopoxvirus Abatino]AYN64767.1 putative CPXV219 protein [Orthopoxvirus Abatino]
MNLQKLSLAIYLTATCSWCYETCMRKTALFHDNNLEHVEENQDSGVASLPYKYLQVVHQRERSRLLATFNWTSIAEEVKNEFIKICDINGTYIYNYTITVSMIIDSTEELPTVTPFTTYEPSTYNYTFDNSTVSTTEELKVTPSPTPYATVTTPLPTSAVPYDQRSNNNVSIISIQILSKILGVNETELTNYLITYKNATVDNNTINNNITVNSTTVDDETSDNNTLHGNIGFLEINNCYNVSVSDASFRITLVNDSSEEIVLMLTGTSSSDTFISSTNITECLKTLINNTSNISDVSITQNMNVTSNCDKCSMNLMTSVIPVVNEFNNTLEKIGVKDDKNNTVHNYYNCKLTTNSTCDELINLDEVINNITLTNIISSSASTNNRKRRDLNGEFEFSTSKELDCLYEVYGVNEDISHCFASPRHRRSDDKQEFIEMKLLDHAKKDLSIDSVIPRGTTHFQVGASGASGGVVGDSNPFQNVKSRASLLAEKIMPRVPTTATEEQLYATINRQAKLPAGVKSTPFTEAVVSTINQKLSSVKEVTYASLNLPKSSGYIHRPSESVIYSTIRRTRLPSDSDSDFEDIQTVVKEYNERYGRRVSRTQSSSSSDFEDIDTVVREIKQKYGGAASRVRTSSSSSSDFEDIDTVVREYNQRYGNAMTKGRGSPKPDPLYSTVKKTPKSIASGVDIVSKQTDYSLLPGVNTGSSIVTPLTRRGATRRPKHPSLPSRKDDLPPLPPNPPRRQLPRGDDDYSLLQVPQRDYSPPPLPPRGPPPLPPKPAGQVPPRDQQDNNKGFSKFVPPRRCRRASSGVICGMIQSRPNDKTYSLLQRPDAEPEYAEVGNGIPKNDVPVIGKKHSKKYKSSMTKISTKFDKSTAFGAAMLLTGQQAINQQVRSTALIRKDQMSKDEKIFEAVTMTLSTIGSTLTTAGMIAPPLMIAGMGISLISGIIDTVKDIYYLFSGHEKPVDPVVKLFNTYAGLVSNSNKMGVRKCLTPGEDTLIYIAYKNDSSFKQNTEAMALYFLDVIDSEILYLNTSNLVLEYQLKVACPIGTLRSVDVDITAYTILYDTEDNIKKYKFIRMATLLSKHPVIRLTCGLAATLVIRPYEVPISDMQLLKMATPGEPESTKSIPSDVCDRYPLKKFYLLAGGCPYDTSQTFIVHTTCSILLRTATRDQFRNRWVLQNPFRQEGTYKQLFTFSKYDFNDTIIDPNGVAGHASFCTNRSSNQCFWTEPMILEDVSSCSSRTRKIYVKLGIFNTEGFNSFVLNCPTGSTPTYIKHKNADSDNVIIELPVGDYGTAKLYSATKPSRIAVFCTHNYDKRFKSDIIVLMFNKNSGVPFWSMYTGSVTSRNRMFTTLARGMPFRSTYCDNRRPGCYYAGIPFNEESVEATIHYGPEIMLKETYDATSIDKEVILKSKTYFSTPINIKFNVHDLGNAYNNHEKFWNDAKNKKRTYSAIAVKILPCTVRNKNVDFGYNYGHIISNMVYAQSISQDYGDGTKYIFKSVNKSDHECESILDLTSKEVTVTCPAYSIPRNISAYEGLCFSVATSKDHCAANNEWLKSYGYGKADATKQRACFHHWNYATTSLDYYCSSENVFKSYWPDYDPCKSYIHIEYRDTWIESNVLQQPPYTFEFTHDNSNEYVDKEISNKLNDLYNEYKKIMEYSDGSLPASINRLAKALTSEGREIASVNIDGNLLDIAYQADKEKMADIQNKINDITRDLFIHTLSDKDIKDIIESEESKRCCIIDVKNNRVEKYYPIDNYLCGTLDDYIYTSVETNKSYVLVNDTYMSYDYLESSGVVVLSCYEMTIISLDTKDAKDAIEDEIVASAVAEALNDMFKEFDKNVSAIIIKEEDNYLNRSPDIYHIIYIIGGIILLLLVIILILAIYIARNKYRTRKYKIMKYDNMSIKSEHHNSLETVSMEIMDNRY